MNDERLSDDAKDVALFEELCALKGQCGTTDKNVIATILIHGCIANGWDTRGRIVGALKRLGLDYRHANITLNQGTGDNPMLHRWSVDRDGSYSSIE